MGCAQAFNAPRLGAALLLDKASSYLLAPAVRARAFLAEPAKIFGPVVAHDDDVRAEQVANRVIGSAALWLFWRRLLLLQQEPVKLVILTHRWLEINYWLQPAASS